MPDEVKQDETKVTPKPVVLDEGESDREKQMRELRDGQGKISVNSNVVAAEQGVKNAEEALAADPDNVALKEELACRRRNLEKAKRMYVP